MLNLVLICTLQTSIGEPILSRVGEHYTEETQM
jgi:hypothetical protein